jgi:hypothetical protein
MASPSERIKCYSFIHRATRVICLEHRARPLASVHPFKHAMFTLIFALTNKKQKQKHARCQVPCSHIAIVDRLKAPHPMQEGDALVTVRRNRDRVAAVWLGKHAKAYVCPPLCNKRDGCRGRLYMKLLDKLTD